VRLKRYLEMRGADSGPARRLCALPALWAGLLYNTRSLDAAWQMVKDWTMEDREALRRSVPTEALQATVGGRTIREIAREALTLSRAGLDAQGVTDSSFLNVLDDIVESGRTPADELLKLYHGPWQGDITRVFRECAY
jgi:glutamate--cysteine ligase